MWKIGWFVKKVISPQNVIINDTNGREIVIHREKIRKVNNNSGNKDETSPYHYNRLIPISQEGRENQNQNIQSVVIKEEDGT